MAREGHLDRPLSRAARVAAVGIGCRISVLAPGARSRPLVLRPRGYCRSDPGDSWVDELRLGRTTIAAEVADEPSPHGADYSVWAGTLPGTSLHQVGGDWGWNDSDVPHYGCAWTMDDYNRFLPWKSFASIFGSTYDLLRGIAPTKPIAIAEVASMEKGGSKAAWITAMFRDLRLRFPQVRALIWFEKYEIGISCPIESSKSSAAAFRRGIDADRYPPNRFALLRGGPVKPLP